jgi:hypothetical protein
MLAHQVFRRRNLFLKAFTCDFFLYLLAAPFLLGPGSARTDDRRCKNPGHDQGRAFYQAAARGGDRVANGGLDMRCSGC